MLQRVNLGRVPEQWQTKELADVNAVEYVSWAPLIVGILVLGVAPVLIFGITNDAVAALTGLF
jgi:NADH:ubiquinone oxidoreductase subunit 4 (subunit M)